MYEQEYNVVKSLFKVQDLVVTKKKFHLLFQL